MSIIRRSLGLCKKINASTCIEQARTLNTNPWEAYATVTIFDRKKTTGLFKDGVLINQIDFKKFTSKLNHLKQIKDLGGVPRYYRDLIRKPGLPEGFQARVILINDRNYIDNINIHNNVLYTINKKIITIPCPYIDENNAIILDFFTVFNSLKLNKDDIKCYNARIKFEDEKEDEIEMAVGRKKQKDGSTGARIIKMSGKYSSEFGGIQNKIKAENSNSSSHITHGLNSSSHIVNILL